MTIDLNAFGYATMKGNGAAATGERPLLVILVRMTPANGPAPELAHGSFTYSERIFGSPFAYNQTGPVYIRNVRDYTSENSCGRFTWKPAGAGVVGPIVLSAADSALDLNQRRPRIVQIVRDQGLFDFSPYDLSRDCTVAGGELGVLIIDTGSNSGGQTNGHGGLTLGCGPSGGGSMGISVAGQRASLTLAAHELAHHFGAHDLYGFNELLNRQCTLMAQHEGDDGTAGWHLDPWHKMRLGWCEPQIHTLAAGVSGIQLTAPGAQDPNGASILYDPARGTNEYFIVEFRNPRQASGLYDTGVASRGIAVWHVVVNNQFNPIEIPVDPAKPQLHYKGVWLEADPDPATGVVPLPGQVDRDFQRAGTRLWDRRRITPALRWADGTSTGVRISVRDFGDTADGAVVDLLPETMRRQHHGSRLIQSAYGQVGNYELVVPQGSRLAHYWRNNDDPAYAWHPGHLVNFGPREDGPTVSIGQWVLGASLLQSTIRGNGTDGNLDVVVRLRSRAAVDDAGDHLAFLGYDTARGRWSAAQDIVADGVPVAGVTGDPSFLQSDFGNAGNYELVVPHDTKLAHYWRNNEDPAYAWHRGHVIDFGPRTDGRTARVGQLVLGATMLQSTIKGDGRHGNFEVVVRLRPRLARDGTEDSLAFLAYDTGTRAWTPAAPIVADGAPIAGVTADPALIQSGYGGVGNYELFVPQGSKLAHYWRNNDDPAYAWHRGHVIDFGPSGSGQNLTMGHWVLGVAVLQSTIRGNGTDGNFEVAVRLRPRMPADDGGDPVFFLGYDTGSGRWSRAQPIVADGHPVLST